MIDNNNYDSIQPRTIWRMTHPDAKGDLIIFPKDDSDEVFKAIKEYASTYDPYLWTIQLEIVFDEQEYQDLFEGNLVWEG